MRLAAFALLATLASAVAQLPTWQAGITEPIFDATLTSTTIGVIAKIHCQEGDAVKEGQMLVELYRRPQELEVKRHAIDMEAKKKDYERTQALFERTSSVSREELDLKEAAYRTAEAEWELAKTEYEDRVIRAPFSGVITDLFSLSVGEGVEIGAQVARLVDTGRFVFVASVPKDVADLMSKTQRVEVEVGEGGQATAAQGVISFISAVADPSSGLTKIKAVCDNAARKIRPGMPAKLRLAPAATAANAR